MIHCKDVATALSTDQLDAQPRLRRAAMGFHLTVCRPCRAFRRQLAVLKTAASTMRNRYDEEAGPDFADRVHQRLLK